MSGTTTIAFFGATGGCANACLTHVLKSSTMHVRALARTPSKLTTQLLNQGISQETLDTRLHIIKGDATDAGDIKSTLILTDTTTNPSRGHRQITLVNTIIAGIGGTPKRDGLGVTLDNPHITEEFTTGLLSALADVAPFTGSAPKPLLGVISTTGVVSMSKDTKDKDQGVAAPNDVPCLFRGLYSYFLHVPHVDKERMERILDEQATLSLVRGVIVVRPSLLVGTQDITSGKGWKKLRVGTERAPAVGYTVSRADVGEWMFEEIVKNEGGEYVGEKVTLTN